MLATPVLPGSILKTATLIAALESGVVGPETRMPCPRKVEVGGRRVDCSHPDLGRPIGPAEALAHSCNAYFAAVAGRLRRESLDGVLVQLGLPPTAPSVPMPAAALGIDGNRVAADRLLTAILKVTGGTLRLRDDTRRVVLEGLRGAAAYGTASAFGDSGLTAFAKTGTAPMPGGGYEGLVVAAFPAGRPTKAIVLIAPGGTGRDAARLAAEVAAAPPAIRVGSARRDGGYDVSRMPLEEYVARVVSAEAEPSSGVESLKALAIVARTFALTNLRRHERDGFDMCDLTHCQVVGARTRAGDEAAGATRGRTLFHAGRLANVFYTASCGGRSESAAGAWGGTVSVPYLPVRDEPECRLEPSWRSEVSARELQRALASVGIRGAVIRNLSVIGRSASGRAARIRLDGLEPEEMSGEAFRLAVGRMLGWQVLKSALFDVERTSTGYRFVGRGRGHGVGLCVAGAARMAAQGRSAAEILARYFPGTTVADGNSDTAANARAALRVQVSLPPDEQRERERIEGLCRAVLAEYSARARVEMPSRVELVFHPTVEAYTRASGQPWWTIGATRGVHVDLVPLAVLRQRHRLEEVLRHELAHVVIGGRLEGRPIWVKEAAAMELAGDTRAAAAATRGPASCPTDAEWLSARSPEALQDAYGRAAACFAAQRASGRGWEDVR